MFLIVVIIFIWFLFNTKFNIYKKFSGVVYKEGVIELIVSDEELKLFYKNVDVFINDKKEKIKIRNINKDILERNGVSYNQVFLEVSFTNMYKVNDVIEISVLSSRDKLIKIFKVIWEGD